MSKNAMDHVVLTDDSGAGTDGTILNNALFDQVQDAVDAALLHVVQTKSGNYTVLVTDDAVVCTAALTLTLYAASGNAGRELDVPNRGTANVTLDGNASETINGTATYTVAPLTSVRLRCDGSNWFVVAGHIPDERVVVLTDGATPALDASLGNVFTLAAVGDRTIAVPTNPTSGQKIVIRHLASGGARTLALNTGAGGFRFGTDITALTQTASGLTDYIGCIYNAVDNKFDVVAYSKGY